MEKEDESNPVSEEKYVNRVPMNNWLIEVSIGN